MSARPYPPFAVLVVDDETAHLDAVKLALGTVGINNVRSANSGEAALAAVDAGGVGVALIDLMMPGITGKDLLKVFAERYPEMPVLVITAVDEVESAVSAVRAGAFDYLVKPVETGRLTTSVQRAIELRRIADENHALRAGLFSAELKHPEAFEALVTADPAMLRAFHYIEAVGPSDRAVLITGDTGVGKELFAQAVHGVSGRRGEFVEFNVAGVDDAMFSDVLFGHRKGAFTGADGPRAGLVERAAGGTLFLDEIGDLAPASQVKLLRLLQSGQYYPVGSDVPKMADCRVVAATNLSPEAMRTGQRFRTDLFYRLHSHHVAIPPLRSRQGDLPLLLEHFLTKAATALSRPIPTFPKELITLLGAYTWPGNVRELEAMVFDSVSSHPGGVLSMQRFVEHMGLDGTPPVAAAESGPLTFGERLPSLKEAEWLVIEEALRRAEGSQTLAARLLGMSRQALNNRIRRERTDT